VGGEMAARNHLQDKLDDIRNYCPKNINVANVLAKYTLFMDINEALRHLKKDHEELRRLAQNPLTPEQAQFARKLVGMYEISNPNKHSIFNIKDHQNHDISPGHKPRSN
jgi:hypothetical protein